MRLGNTTLVEHGIQTEAADYRAHVCPDARRVYVFPTAPAVALIGSGRYQLRGASQPGVDIQTAKGYAVPIGDIEGIQEIVVPDSWWDRLALTKRDDLATKGRKAAKMVGGVLSKGLVMLPWSARQAESSADLAGVDLVAYGEHLFQVKCDFRGGPRALGGTGNLFLQTMECNPLGIH